MLYQIKDGTVSAGGQTILSHVDFYIKEKEKIEKLLNIFLLSVWEYMILFYLRRKWQM